MESFVVVVVVVAVVAVVVGAYTVSFVWVFQLIIQKCRRMKRREFNFKIQSRHDFLSPF